MNRRVFAKSVAAVVAGTALPLRADTGPPPGFGADIHCHIMNARDLEIVQFIERFTDIAPEARRYIPAGAFKFAEDWAKSAVEDSKLVGALTSWRKNALEATASKRVNISDGGGRTISQAIADDIKANPERRALLERALPNEVVDTDLKRRKLSFDEQVQALDADALFFAGRMAGSRTETLQLLCGSEVSHDLNVSLFTPLMVDFAGFLPGQKEKYRDLVLFYAAVAARSAELNRDCWIHPFIGFCPRASADETASRKGSAARDNLSWTLSNVPADATRRELVEVAVLRWGFAGVKIYPPNGFLPLGNAQLFSGGEGPRIDEELRWLYHLCSEHDIPLVAHANASNGLSSGSAEMTSPWRWRQVLDEFDLRLDLGHFGALTGVDGTNEPNAWTWPGASLELMREHEKVFCDLSCNPMANTLVMRIRMQELLDKLLDGPGGARLRARLMFGTDYFMNALSEKPATWWLDMVAAYPWSKIPGFFGENALRFLNVVDEMGKFTAPSQRERLTRVYGKKPPAWLGPPK